MQPNVVPVDSIEWDHSHAGKEYTVVRCLRDGVVWWLQTDVEHSRTPLYLFRDEVYCGQVDEHGRYEPLTGVVEQVIDSTALRCLRILAGLGDEHGAAPRRPRGWATI